MDQIVHQSLCRGSVLILAALKVACGSNVPVPAPENSVSSTPAAVQKALPGPVPGTRITPEYAAQVGRMAYLWAWP
jgi:hypothetical protein